MFANVVYLILGFIIGFLIAIICGAGGRTGLEEQIAALEVRNEKLRDKLNREETDEQDKDHGDDAIGVEKDPFDGIEK